MRIAHTSDLHLGRQLSEMSLLEDQRYILEKIVREAIAHDADVLAIAGDVYDRTSPSAEAVAMLDRFLDDVAASGLTTLIVPGNHDSAERVSYARSAMRRVGIHIAEVFDGKMEQVALEDEHGPVRFWLLPFVKPAHVRPHFPDADIGTDYTRAVRTVVGAADIDPQERNVLVAHQFVTCGGSEPERTASELSLGGLDGVDASAFDPFDYVALGHVHRAQQVSAPHIRYSGSPLKYSLSEALGEKSLTLVDLGAKGEVAIERIPLEPLRDLREVKGPWDEVAQAAREDEAGRLDYVHVTLTDERPPHDAMALVRSVFPNAVGLAFDNARTRAAGVCPDEATGIEETSPFELFREFYERQNGTPMTEAQERLALEAMEGDAR